MIDVKFRLDLTSAKKFFFDRVAVTSSVSKAGIKVLSRFGSYVRRSARQLIKNPTKSKPHSAPGEPPRNQLGLLKNFIFFSFDPVARSVVIGPVKLPRTGNAPEALEYGGPTTISVRQGNRRKKVRKVIEARPYMQPAFDKNKDKITDMWRDAVKP